MIVPIGPREEAWRQLLPELGAALPRDSEVVLAATEPAPGLPELSRRLSLRWIEAPRGRARQLNAGARAARGEHLWFLHADTRLQSDAPDALLRSIDAAPRALHYFDLRFLDDGPALMWVNEAGTWFRSRVLGMPFGDQGLCFPRDEFEKLGGYSESAPYGEDHLLVWAARRSGMPLRYAGSSIRTSARKYRDRGWLSQTSRTLLLTYLQAAPEAARWLRERRGSR